MAAFLYSLHLSKSRDGFGKPAVRSIPTTGIAGHLCPVTGVIVVPDPVAIRAALPHYYRKAFDRGHTFWFTDQAGKPNPPKPAHMTLLDRRGHTLNTLYAIPYVFKVEGEK